MVDTFVSPLRALKLLSEEQLDILFGNVAELATNNAKFREALEDVHLLFHLSHTHSAFNCVRRNSLHSKRVDNWNVEQKIGDVFCKNIHLLEPHARYCQNFAKASTLKVRSQLTFICSSSH